MAHDPFFAFMNLTLFDKEIVELKGQLSDFEVQISRALEEKVSLEKLLKNSHDIVHKAKKLVDEKELEMKDLDSKEKEEKKKFDKVKNQKEYESVNKELEKISQDQHSKESDLIDSWNRLESSKREYDKLEKKNEEDVKLVEEKLEELKQKTAEAEIICQKKIEGRPTVVNMVQKEMLERYNIIQGQVLDPVVVVDGDSCSACFYQVPHTDLINLKKRKLLQCKNCYRFLYLEEFANKDLSDKISVEES